MVRTMTNKQFLSAVQSRGLPTDWLSPGAAAAELGITRQAVHDRIRRGTLDAIKLDDGVIYVDVRDVRAAKREKAAIERARGERERKRAGAGTM